MSAIYTVEETIMRRVHRIHRIRTLLYGAALKVFVLAACSILLVSTVSVANVLANMAGLGSLWTIVAFLMHAVTHTELLVQFLLAGIAGVLFLLLRDVAQRGKQLLQPLRHA